DSTAAIDRYFTRYVGLFASVQAHGLRPATRAESTHPWRMGAVISVAMGPQGRWIKLPGAKHRVAIAQALGLPRIPVQLGMVHADAIRQVMRERSLPPLPALRELLERFRNEPNVEDAGKQAGA